MSRASLLLGFPSGRAQAERLAYAADIDGAEIELHTFPDGESRVRLPPRLPPHVIVYTSLNNPDAKLVQLILASRTARELGTEHLTLVAPYLCYMRQDVAFRPGEAVSQRIIGRLLADLFDGVITVDPHLHRTHDFADAVPAEHAIAVTAADAMADWLETRDGAPLLLGPDVESGQWVRAIAERAGLDHGVASKTRHGDRDVSIALPDLPFDGRDIVLIDDIVSSGQTLITCTEQLVSAGAKGITVLCTHALFDDDAAEQLALAGVDDIVSTDSVPHPSNGIELAKLLASVLDQA